MVGEFDFGAHGEVGAVALAIGDGGVVPEGIETAFGKGLAAGIRFEATGVIVVLVVFPLAVQFVALVFVHQCVGGVLEGVVLHGHGGGFHPFPVAELEDGTLAGAAASLGVVFHRLEPGGVAVVVGDDEGRLVVAFHIAVVITVVPAFFGGQALDKGQVAFPVLDAVFPFFGGALEIKHSIDKAPLFQQGAHDGVGGLGLEDAAVVHQVEAPQRWLDDDVVTGAAMAGVAPDEFVDHAGKAPQRYAVLPHHQFHGLFQHVFGGDVGGGTGQFQLAVAKPGKVLGQLETGDHEQVFGELAKGGRELQSGCLGHVFDP